MTDWWASLQHGGLLIAPSKLAEFYPDQPWPLSGGTVDRLRRDVIRAQGGERKALLDTVLELVLDLSAPDTGGRWIKGSDVPATWTRRAVTGEAVRPIRLWLGSHESTLPIFWDDATRLGVGAGRRMAARVIEWLRRDGGGLALLTNGLQWRLIHAGLDSDAFAEWDAGLWFEEGVPGPQVAALQALLSVRSLGKESPGSPCLLLQAIEATRRGQAELSAELGEQVRRAVELLIEAHSTPLAAIQVPPRQIYIAAVRVVMRMVVTLFAEARDLLPRDNPLYHASYGLQGLREELERVGGGTGRARLRHRRGAWPRLLALFRLVHGGSPHEQLPVPAYGGGLFEAGNPESDDGVSRALAILEDPAHEVSDQTVLSVLELLTRTRVKVRQGARATWTPMPVDFSDLSSEYIGILYEGLLDFELRRVAVDDPIVFLRLGDEPALPLSRLEQMSDQALGGLLAKFKQKQRIAATDESESEGDEGEEAVNDEEPADEEQEEEREDVEAAEPGAATEEEADQRQAARERALAWARRAVVAGGMAPRPRRRGAAAAAEHITVVEATANSLLSRIVLPGEWYLVRFGGTRKGSGTFYTRPALAVPTVQRTLRPLAYAPPTGEDDTALEAAPAADWAPRAPDTILGLKVCDPGAGSGSFLVAALRFLTEALAESLHVHGRIKAHGDHALVTLALGEPGGEALAEELLPCRPDAPEFDARLRARLRRYVVERCLYGVDLDPLAVELARMALWIETMDRSLPFGFLDHKIKCGNSLVGCWFDRFRDYPALAFEREGGDKAHNNGVHFAKGAWTDAIKAFRNDRLKPALVAWITGAGSLFDTVEGKAPEAVHDEALRVFEAMHALPVHEAEERARLYREEVQGNPAVAALREAFDTWCALWFWPADRLEAAPQPQTLGALPEEGRAVVRTLVGEHRFFHWELEFPDVFAAAEGGFHAMIGNPPWETLQPQSKEFFSNLDPLYRSYGKQEALGRQTELFGISEKDEHAWLQYNTFFKSFAAFAEHAAAPFGDPAEGAKLTLAKGSQNAALHERWRRRRGGRCTYADRSHPYRHQGGGKAYTYKLFMEQAWALVRTGGRVGMITPSGIYTDKGSVDLRTLFLDHGRWRWLFGFENRSGIFDIHRSFKFCPIIVEKGGTTAAIETAFMRRDVAEWAAAEKVAIPYRREHVAQFSPSTRAILEIRNRRDLEILEKIYANSVLLGDQGPDGWELKYAQGDFNMTSDSRLFHARPALEAEGYVADEYGRWLQGRWRPRERGTPADPARARWELAPGVLLSQDGARWIEEGEVEEVALPLYEGRMIGQFDFSDKGWVSGRGRGAVWQKEAWPGKRVMPQYLMNLGQASSEGFDPRTKISLMDIGSATNARTLIATLLSRVPCGHSATILDCAFDYPFGSATILGYLNSFVFDWQLRQRLGGLHLTWSYLAETALLTPRRGRGSSAVGVAVLSLACNASAFAPLWIAARHRNGASVSVPMREWAFTDAERLRLRCAIDAVAGVSAGLTSEEMGRLLADCDLPVNGHLDSARRSLDPKGFWRVDKDRAPELRQSVLSLIASSDLQTIIASHGGDLEKGIEAFFSMNDGEGWMLPETLRLSDYGLGHDDRARQHQPVRERLGPRFFDFQLEQSVEDSWKECRLHARNLLGEAGFAALERELAGGGPAPIRRVTETRVDPSTPPGQAGLFDE